MSGLEIVLLILDIVLPLVALVLSIDARVYVRRKDFDTKAQKWRDGKDAEILELDNRLKAMERGFTKDNNERWMMHGVWKDTIDTQTSEIRRYVSLSLNVLNSILTAIEQGKTSDMVKDKDKIARFREETSL